MRFKATAILIVVAALVLAYFFFVDQPRQKRHLERTRRQTALTELSPNDITRISITRSDVTLEFELKNNIWQMLEPTTDRADQSSVNTLLHTVINAQIEKSFSIGEAELAEYGLDEPVATIRLAAEPREGDLVLHIGDFALTKHSCFARIGDGTDVMLLPAGIRRNPLRAVFEFRDKKIIELSPDNVSSVTIVSNGRSVQWGRDDTGRWMTSLLGDTIRGDNTSIENIIRELRGLRAKDIPLGGAAEETYFQKIAGTVTLSVGPDPALVKLTFSEERSTGCYVKTSVSERIALIEPTVLHIFDKTYDDLRDRRLLDFDPERATKITVETTGTTLSIVRRATGWSFSNPEFGVIDNGTATALLSRLTELKFSRALEERLRDPTGFGFAGPVYRVAIYDSDNRKIDELKAGHPLPSFEQSYVTSLSTGVLAGIETSLLSDLLTDFQNLATE